MRHCSVPSLRSGRVGTFRLAVSLYRRQAKGNGETFPEILIKITRLGMCAHQSDIIITS